MQIKVVTLAAWCALEDRLAARYPKATWRADAILTGLMGFPYWRIPTHEDVHEQTGGLSRSALVRRRVQAAAELPRMVTLPRLTDAGERALLEQRAAFGLQVDIVRPADRHLSFYHLWGLCDRRIATDLVVDLMGGRWLVPAAVLQEELARRQDEDAVELLKLHAERRRAAPSPDRGPQVVGFTF